MEILRTLLHTLQSLALNVPPGFWVILGLGLLLLRMKSAFYAPSGIYGMAALCLGATLWSHALIAPDIFSQFVAFAVLALLFHLLLWLPQQLWRIWQRRYRYLIGITGIVLKKDLMKGKTGVVEVLGQRRRAQIPFDCIQDRVASGDGVRIIDTRGGLMIVEPLTVPMPTHAERESYKKHLKENPLGKKW